MRPSLIAFATASTRLWTSNRAQASARRWSTVRREMPSKTAISGELFPCAASFRQSICRGLKDADSLRSVTALQASLQVLTLAVRGLSEC